MAPITNSVLVLLVLLFLTRPLEFMPDVVLATVVFLIGLDLVDMSGMRQIFLERPAEFWVPLITALIVVFVGVKEGWKAQPVTTQVQFLPGLMGYRFTHSIYYANSQLLAKEVTRLVREAKPPHVWFCIVADAVDDVDYTAAATLRSLHGFFKKHGIRLVFSDVSDHVYANCNARE